MNISVESLKKFQGARVFIDHRMRVNGPLLAVCFSQVSTKEEGGAVVVEANQGLGLFFLLSDTVTPDEPSRRVMVLQTPELDGHARLRWVVNVIDQDEDFLEGELLSQFVIEREVARVH